MSMTVVCPKCGNYMEVPAYPGDGVYSRHTCEEPETSPLKRRSRFEEEEDDDLET